MERLIKLLKSYFESELWCIVVEDKRIIALMSSGYGSGPAEVDITALAHFLARELPLDDNGADSHTTTM